MTLLAVLGALLPLQEADDAALWTERLILTLPEDDVRMLQVGPKGRRVFWVSREGIATLDGVAGPKLVGYGGIETPRNEPIPVMVRGNGVVWSPDGKHMAWLASRGRQSALVVDGVEGEPVDRFNEIAFSADWSRIAYVATLHEQRIIVVDGKKLDTGFEEIGHRVTMSVDGRRIGYRGRRGKVWNAVADGKPLGESDEGGEPSFSADGRRVAYVAREAGGQRLVVDGQKGARFDLIYQPLFSPDGRSVACPARLGQKSHVVLDGTPGAAFAEIDGRTLVFSADGKHLAYVGDQQLILDGTPRFRLAPIGAPVLSADGSRWACLRSSQMSGYEAVVDGEVYTGYSSGLALSPVGGHVAFVGFDTVMMNRLRSPRYDAILCAPIFSRDGKKVAYAARSKREVHWKVEPVLSELGPGEPAALEDFRKIGALLEKAASYRLRVQGEQTTLAKGTVKSEVSILAKGNRFKVSASAAGQPPRSWMVCDGTNLAMPVAAGQPWGRTPVRPEARASLDAALHMGVPLALWLYVGGTPSTYDVRALKGTDGKKGLSYVLILRESGRVIRGDLWYDPRTLVPARRVLWLGFPEDSTITETFQDFAPGAEIPDAEFTLPD